MIEVHGEDLDFDFGTAYSLSNCIGSNAIKKRQNQYMFLVLLFLFFAVSFFTVLSSTLVFIHEGPVYKAVVFLSVLIALCLGCIFWKLKSYKYLASLKLKISAVEQKRVKLFLGTLLAGKHSRAEFEYFGNDEERLSSCYSSRSWYEPALLKIFIAHINGEIYFFANKEDWQLVSNAKRIQTLGEYIITAIDGVDCRTSIYFCEPKYHRSLKAQALHFISTGLL